MTLERALKRSIAESRKPAALIPSKSKNAYREENKPEHLLTGLAGEEMAAAFLLAKGFKLIAKNVRYPCGEIDIIAEDGDELVFVEVRTRRIGLIMPAECTVGPEKLKKLIKTAKLWTEERRYEGLWRVDLVAITLNSGCEPVFEHIGDITEGIL